MANEQCNKELTQLIDSCFWVEIYLAILRKIDEKSNLDCLSYYSDLSIAITKALVDAAIIALSKIYDKKSTGTNIISLLNKIDSDKNFIDSEKRSEIKKFAKKQKKELECENIKRLINNLKTWRDKYYAHIDKEYLNAEDVLRREYGISVEEFEQLLNFASYTVKHLYRLINESSIGSPKMRCEKEFDLLVKILEQHRQMYNEATENLDEINFSSMSKA